MPWHIEKRQSKFVVVKDSDGSVAGTHVTREQAQRQLRALYANTKE
jgi:hypothetical protein